MKNTYQENELSWAKRFIRTLLNNRDKIMMTGYAGSGKTTMLTVLDKRRDVTDEDVRRNTSGQEVYRIGYKTDNGNRVFIKSTDIAGLDTVVNQTDFDKLLKDHKYFVYIINVDSFLSGKYSTSEQETILSWYRHVYYHAKKFNRPMILVLSHADQYLSGIGKDYTVGNKHTEIRDKFFGANGILSVLGCISPDEIANIQKYDEVKKIIDKLIS